MQAFGSENILPHQQNLLELLGILARPMLFSREWWFQQARSERKMQKYMNQPVESFTPQNQVK
jgi:hypothetical protein